MTRDLRTLAGVVGVSAGADLLVFVALMLHVHEAGAGPVALAAVVATTLVPQVLLAPVGGLLADRRESVRVFALATAAQAVCAALLITEPGLGALLALSALLAAGNALAQPAEFALVPVAAAGRGLTRANGAIETSRYVGYAVGPVVAASLMSGAGLAGAMLLAAGLLGVLALATPVALRVRRPPQARAGTSEDRAREGLRHLVADPVLRPVVGAAVAALVVVSMTLTAEVVYLVESVGASGAVYGAVLASWTVGMAAGAMGVAGRIPARHQPWVALVALAVQGAGIAGQTLWAVVPAAAVGYLLGGLGHGVKNTLVRTVVQRRVPPAVHGRAFAAYNASRNAAELAATALAGVLVAGIGARAALAVAGIVPILAACAGLVALRRAGDGRDVPSRAQMARPGDGGAYAEA